MSFVEITAPRCAGGGGTRTSAVAADQHVLKSFTKFTRGYLLEQPCSAVLALRTRLATCFAKLRIFSLPRKSRFAPLGGSPKINRPTNAILPRAGHFLQTIHFAAHS